MFEQSDLPVLINNIKTKLTAEFHINIVAICPGYMAIPFQRKKLQPYIIFTHDDNPEAINIFKSILKSFGVDTHNYNDFIKSIFEPKTGNLRWMISMPEQYVPINKLEDIIAIWVKMYKILNDMTNDTEHS